MIRVYIAGPYTKGDVAQNVSEAIFYAHELMSMGFAPCCPHLSHFLHLQHQRPYEEWMTLDLVWLEQCEAVFRIEGESAGADREVARARQLGLPVFHNLCEVRDWSEARR